MKANVKKGFENYINSPELCSSFFELLDQEDEKFDMVYKDVKKTLVETFNDKKNQNYLLEILKMSPLTEKDLNEMDNFKKEIQEDDSLSDNKKDLLLSYLTSIENISKELSSYKRVLVKVNIQKIHENAVIPTYAHSADAGADIYAIEDITLKPHTTTIVPTGLKVEVPDGYMLNIYPRSGLSAKTNIRVANSVGVIDSQYTGEVGVILDNIGNLSYTIHKGDKIAQMILQEIPAIKFVEVDSINETERGDGGFGSTDNKS